MTASTITLNQLESHLWEAANILRGPVDAADFKTYVFPLLFFKRLSDVHDEEHQTALEESGGDEAYARFPQNYRFQVPEDCHWRDVRDVLGQFYEYLINKFADATFAAEDKLIAILKREGLLQ